MMAVYKLWTRLYYLKVPFWRGWGERGDCRLVGLCFVFKKFALVCYYRISRKGKRSSGEIPTVTTQPSLGHKHHQNRSCLCPFLPLPEGLCITGTQ